MFHILTDMFKWTLFLNFEWHFDGTQIFELFNKKCYLCKKNEFELMNWAFEHFEGEAMQAWWTFIKRRSIDWLLVFNGT